MSTRWQYKIVEVKAGFLGLKPASIEATLTPLGQQGWELVSVVQHGLAALLYLKKPH